MTYTELSQAIDKDTADLAAMKADLETLHAGGTVENLTIPGAESTIAGLEACITNKQALLVR